MSNQVYPFLTDNRRNHGISGEYGLCYNSFAFIFGLNVENEEKGLKARSVEIFVFS